MLRSAAIDTGLLEATAALGELLSVLARRAPGPVGHALKDEIALVVFPRDGTPISFRVRFQWDGETPARVVVVPGHVARPRTRIACTKQALRHWVRGDLDLKEARERRVFFVEGDGAPFRALAAALDAHEHTVVRPAPLSTSPPAAPSIAAGSAFNTRLRAFAPPP